MRTIITVDDELYQRALELADPGMDKAYAGDGRSPALLHFARNLPVAVGSRGNRVPKRPSGRKG